MYFKNGLSIVFDDETERLLIMDEFDGFIIGRYDNSDETDDFGTWVECKTPFLISPSRISPVSETFFNDITDGVYPSSSAFSSTGEVFDDKQVIYRK